MIWETLRLLIAFSIGVVVGRYSHKWTDIKDFDGGDIVLLAVVLIWFFSRIVAMFDRTYVSSPYIDGLMGLIVGFFYKKGKVISLPKIPTKENKNEKTN